MIRVWSPVSPASQGTERHQERKGKRYVRRTESITGSSAGSAFGSVPAPRGRFRRTRRGRGGGGQGGRGGGPGGPRRGKRQFFRKKKVCKFCVEKMDLIDYKRADILSQFVQERGKI